MNSNGGRAAGSGKREFYTALALLAMIFAVTTALFALPAWAQSEGLEDNRVRDADTDDNNNDLTDTDTTSAGPDNIDLIEILDAENCDVDPGAVIVFEDERGRVFLVADNINAQISERGDEIRVVDDRNDDQVEDPPDTGSDADIEFLDEDGDFVELSVNRDLSVQSVGGIECGDGRSSQPGLGPGPFIPEPFPPEAFPPGVVNPVTGEIIDEDDDGIPDVLDEEIDANEEDDEDETDDLEDAENDLNALNDEGTDGEGTDGDDFDTDSEGDDDGVSATADEDGAEASTPGASASAGGDPDEQAPERSTRGDVVDEVPTSGPLPNTGGAPVAAGTVLAMVLFGVGLLTVRLVMVWRERRA